MELQFVGKNIEVTEAIKTVTATKLEVLKKRYSQIHQINVVFHIEHDDQIAEATIHMNGLELHATAKSPDLYKSIDLLIDKLLTQLTKHKEKLTDSQR